MMFTNLHPQDLIRSDNESQVNCVYWKFISQRYQDCNAAVIHVITCKSTLL